MDAEERARRFAAAAMAESRALPRVQKDVLAEIVRQLTAAQRKVVEQLSAASSESAQRRLRQLQREIEATMDDFRTAAARAASDGASTAWQAGIRSITAPFEAAGVAIAGMRIDARLLLASQRIMTDRIEQLSQRALDRLNGALMQHLIGAAPLSDTITTVQRIMGGVPRSRAMTVAYTEIGRAHSIAQDEALQAAGHTVPNLRKRWAKSGKMHPRLAHVAANGQIRRYDEPYLVDGEKLMYPRDPAGSAANTINCGCLSIPVVDGSSFDGVAVSVDADGNLRKTRVPK